MDSGLISNRYAVALLKYVEETGGGERVCHQVRNLLAGNVTEPVRLEPELQRFVLLLKKKGRLQDVRWILQTFVSLYYRSKGIIRAHLKMTVHVPELEMRLLALLEKRFDCEVDMDTTIDKNLIGGFILILDDYMLDASVRSQIELIRREFIVKNTRIV